MKRIIATICILSLLLSALVGCSTPGNDGDDLNGDGPSQHESTDAVKNRLTLAKNLADKVDVLSSVEQLMGSSLSITPDKRNTKPKTGSTLPCSDVEKLIYERDEDDLGEASEVQVGWANDIINKLKQSKNDALTTCKCLNTWVKREDGAYSDVFRLNYDVTTGTVTVENHSHPSDINSYSKFTVTTDTEGKLIINYFRAMYTPEIIESTSEIHYYEDKYFFSLSMNRDETGGEHENTAFIDLHNKIQASLYANRTVYYENGVPVRTEHEEPNVEFTYEKDGYSFRVAKSGGSVSIKPENGNGRTGSIGSYNNGNAYLSLNILEGWSTLSQSGDWVTLRTNDKGEIQSRNFTTNYLGAKNGIQYNYVIPFYEGYTEPMIHISFTESPDVDTETALSGLIDVLENELGLTLDPEYSELLINAGDGYEDLAKNFRFINGITADNMTLDKYFMILEMMRSLYIPLDTLKTVYNGSGINRNEQVEENRYFEFLDFTLSGKATLDEATAMLNLSAVTAEISPSLLLKENSEYALVFAWQTAGAIFEIGCIDVTYNGSKMSFTGAIEELHSEPRYGYGEYKLVAYIAQKTSGSNDRISKIYEIGATTDATVTSATDTMQSVVTATENGVALTNTVLVPQTSPVE